MHRQPLERFARWQGMIHRIRKAVQRVLGVAGYQVPPNVRDGPSLGGALARLGRRGANLFRTVIDVGASDGRWSSELMRRYPSADYLLIEAQPVHEPKLKEFCARHGNARYVLAAAGPEEGEIYFDAEDPFGGVASHTPVERYGIRVSMTTVDTQVERHALAPPYLVKLDTHGFEVPILRGAAHVLTQTSVLIIECYNFRIAPECLLFHEMCQYLGERGFRCIDMFDLLYRPYDEAFWQMDMVFMRSDRAEFAYHAYQ